MKNQKEDAKMIIAKYIMFRHRRTSIRPETTGKEIIYRLMSTGYKFLLNYSNKTMRV